MPYPTYAARIQGNSCQVVNIQTGQTALVLTPHLRPVRADVSGEFVSVTLSSGRVQIYNLRTKQLTRIL